MTRKRRGLSIVEVVLSLMILSMVMLGIFGVFDMGSHSFQFASLRQGLQSEARLSWILLRDDLRLSTYTSITSLPRTVSVVVPGQETAGPQTLDRDGLSFATVEDWSASTALDQYTGFPNFDSYLVYYASSEPEGRLIRQLVRPATTGPYPYGSFSVSNSMNDIPLSNSNLVSNTTRILSNRVLSFQARVDAPKRMVHAVLRFRGHGGKRPVGSKEADETLELRVDLAPENTYPKL